MKITAKKEIYIERERTLTIRFASAPAARFCAACEAETTFVTANQAALVARTTDREIFRLVEANHLHSAASADGFLLVCLASLQNAGAAINSNQLNIGENL